MAILGVLALLVFGEKKLPGVMRQAGRIMRDVQNTSQSFLREMDRAADVTEPIQPTVDTTPVETPLAETLPVETPVEAPPEVPHETPAHE
jgi:Sec-independent protein translocase protein TatA